MESESSSEFQDTIITEALDSHNYCLQISEDTNQNDSDLSNPIIYKVGRLYICPVCKEKFTGLNHIKKHLGEKHPAISPILFSSNNISQKCDICGKSYQNKGSLQVHKRKKHNLYCSNIKKHKCPLCPQMFERRIFNKHFKDSHNLLLNTIKLNFDSYGKFCEWKKAIENVTKSSFSKQSKRVANGVAQHPFICHRSGNFKQGGLGKRKIRAHGSRKINAFCPATMNAVVKKDGKCEVKFQTKHVGHENELQHLNLTHEERMYIAEKLVNKLPSNKILNDVRNYASECGAERLSLLTKRDLHNIKKGNYIKDAQIDASVAKLNEKLVCSLRDIHNKHAESQHIRATITKIQEGWVLTFVEHNEIYLIKEISKSCNCTDICIYCNVCIKSYSCSCSDSSVEGNMCKHIHFLCMERKKIYNDLEIIYSEDCNNNEAEISSDSEECDYLHTSNSMSSNLSSFSDDLSLPSSDLSKKDKPNITPSVSEKVNTLKNKFFELFDSIKTEEEYKLSESTFQELTTKLDSIQNHSVSKNGAVIPAKQQSLKSIFLSEGIQDQPSSNSAKTSCMPLFLKMPNSSRQNAKFSILILPKKKNNTFKK